MNFEEIKIGFVLTGSFCTFKKVIPIIETLKEKKAKILPIMSYNAYNLDTKFGKAEDFIIEIANFFRENDIYLPDMDKNTSLVYCVKNDINSEKLDVLKIKIEDDPFYFKKYVFAYSEAEADELKKLCKQHKQTPNELIQSYILNANNFGKFKKKASNEKVYRLVSELLIKIPVIPINFKTQGQIKSVPDYMQEIQKCNDDEIGKLDSIIQTLCDSEKKLEETELIDKMLEDWGFVSMEDENE